MTPFVRNASLAVILALGAWSACDESPTDGEVRPDDLGTQKEDNGENCEDPSAPDTADPNRGALLEMYEDGRRIFRYDTFGSEAFWGGALRLHESIAAALTPNLALQLGLKVDVDALPDEVIDGLEAGTVDLDDPNVTVALLKADAVVGVQGFFDETANLASVGIRCSLCHSTVDDSLAPGVGKRLDGWPNRDLDVGRIVALAPTLAPIASLLGVDEATVKTVLESWGPGKYDAELNHDGKAFRPDGKSAATVLPAAFGLAGVNLHTYTGFGSVPYWNAYVAVTQMMGRGTYYDPRLNDPVQYPIAARSGRWNVRSKPDLVTSKLAALHIYQLALVPPTPPEGSFDKQLAIRGEKIFNTTGKCASCHVPPLFTEPGWAMHTAEEMGIDNFQASRSPEGNYYRTTPLGGLFTRMKGGFYHDGRFPDLNAVLDHYEALLDIDLDENERRELIEYLKSI